MTMPQIPVVEKSNIFIVMWRRVNQNAVLKHMKDVDFENENVLDGFECVLTHERWHSELSDYARPTAVIEGFDQQHFSDVTCAPCLTIVDVQRQHCIHVQ